MNLTKQGKSARMTVRRGRFGGLLFLGSRRAQPHSLDKQPSIGGLTSSVTSPQAVAPVEGFAMSKRIPLTQGKVAIVDNADFERLSQWKWHAREAPRTWYAVRSPWKQGKGTTIYMHRVIMNALPGQTTDHRNLDGLDNRHINLRLCTNSQNVANSRKRANCTSQFKGVSWHKATRKWRAQIKVNGRKKHLGGFADEHEAARVYNVAARKYFGEFARLNITM